MPYTPILATLGYVLSPDRLIEIGTNLQIQESRMPKKREQMDDVLDAIVWIRRKSQKHEAVDDFVNAPLTMRKTTKKKAAKRKSKKVGRST